MIRRSILTVGWLAFLGLLLLTAVSFLAPPATAAAVRWHLLGGSLVALLALFSQCWIVAYSVATGRLLRWAQSRRGSGLETGGGGRGNALVYALAVSAGTLVAVGFLSGIEAYTGELAARWHGVLWLAAVIGLGVSLRVGGRRLASRDAAIAAFDRDDEAIGPPTPRV